MDRMETKYPRYTNLDGYIFFVGKELWGSQYMTLKKSSPDAPGMHRVISPNLPPRETTQEAQADLDEYAVAHNLAVYDYQEIEGGRARGTGRIPRNRRCSNRRRNAGIGRRYSSGGSGGVARD